MIAGIVIRVLLSLCVSVYIVIQFEKLKKVKQATAIRPVLESLLFLELRQTIPMILILELKLL